MLEMLQAMPSLIHATIDTGMHTKLHTQSANKQYDTWFTHCGEITHARVRFVVHKSKHLSIQRTNACHILHGINM